MARVRRELSANDKGRLKHAKRLVNKHLARWPEVREERLEAARAGRDKWPFRLEHMEQLDALYWTAVEVIRELEGESGRERPSDEAKSS